MRELLDIEFDGRGVFSNSITIYFRANLAPLLLNKPLSVIYIGNPVLGGFFRMDKDCQSGFLCVNTVGDPKIDPEAASNAAADVSEQTPDRIRARGRRRSESRRSRSTASRAGARPPTLRAASRSAACSSPAMPRI